MKGNDHRNHEKAMWPRSTNTATATKLGGWNRRAPDVVLVGLLTLTDDATVVTGLIDVVVVGTADDVRKPDVEADVVDADTVDTDRDTLADAMVPLVLPVADVSPVMYAGAALAKDGSTSEPIPHGTWVVLSGWTEYCGGVSAPLVPSRGKRVVQMRFVGSVAWEN